MDIIMYVALGLVAGVLSGLLGIAGGIVIIPSLVFFLVSPNNKRRALPSPLWCHQSVSSQPGLIIKKDLWT